MTLPFIIAALGAGLICFLLGRRSGLNASIGERMAGYRLGRRMTRHGMRFESRKELN